MPEHPSDLTSAVVRQVIADTAADPRGTALFLDFDGTLAPFVGSTEDVALEAGLLEVLTDLTARLGAVGVVSGRPVDFLTRVLPLPGLRLAGVYGLEEWVDGQVQDAPGVVTWLDQLAAARDLLVAATEGLSHLIVKDKRVSVVVHRRHGVVTGTDDRRVSALIREIARTSGLRLQVGKSAEELLPPVETHKGAIVRRACRSVGASRLIYVGDDVGDLPAFVAVREIGGLTVVVDGMGAHRAPEAVLRAADLVLPEQRSVLAWLRGLADSAGSARRPDAHASSGDWDSGTADAR